MIVFIEVGASLAQSPLPGDKIIISLGDGVFPCVVLPERGRLLVEGQHAIGYRRLRQAIIGQVGNCVGLFSLFIGVHCDVVKALAGQIGEFHGATRFEAGVDQTD